jgi:hypothetical protein
MNPDVLGIGSHNYLSCSSKKRGSKAMKKVYFLLFVLLSLGLIGAELESCKAPVAADGSDYMLELQWS